MNLTMYTDYSLRVLIYLGSRKGKIVTITEIAQYYRVSRNHLVKVVHGLGKNGFIETIRGKGGGMQLKGDPRQITIGEVVRKTEPNFHIVECFDENNKRCILHSACGLKSVLAEANRAFLEVLDRYTLDRFLQDPEAMKDLWSQVGHGQWQV
ncbi:MAG: Rrf2 family transcriptional regulator [Gammaproteobacteria bacterium]|nr:MAG: Rrf2 family transcriptional regulator [Gammaproteobacteria bacterium]